MDDFRNFEEKELQNKLDQAKKENDLEKRAKMEHEAYDRYFSSLDLSDPDRQGWMAEQQFMREERLQREEGLQKVNDHQKTEKEIIEKTLKEKEEAEKAFLEKERGQGQGNFHHEFYEEREGPGEKKAEFFLPGGVTEKQIESGKDMRRDKVLEKMKNDSVCREIKDIVKNGAGEMVMQTMGSGGKEHNTSNEERMKHIRAAREQAKEKEKSGRER